MNESPHYPLVWRTQCRGLADGWGLRLVTGGRPAGSLMLLVRDGVRAEVRTRKLLGRPPFRPRRGIIDAQLHVEDRPLGLVGCHLSLHREQRLREAGFVDHGTRRWLTFPAQDPVKRIDAILVRGEPTVHHHGEPGVRPELLAAASDHRPVLAVLDV